MGVHSTRETSPRSYGSWKDLEPLILHSIREENFIASGTSAHIYKVDIGAETFVVKKSKDQFFTREKREKALKEVRMMENPNNKQKHLMYAEHHFFHDNHLYIMMEKMDGSLDDLLYSRDENVQELKRLLRKQPVQLLNMFVQIAKGIEELHFQEIIHGDIKPENVLLRKEIVDGKVTVGEVKLSDFGNSEEGALHHTFTGTLGYMAPEIYQGQSEGYTLKADVYSFGILIGEVVTGRDPLNKIEYSSHNFNINGYGFLFELFEKCTKENPNERLNINQVTSELEIHYEKAKLKVLQNLTYRMIYEIETTIKNVEQQFKYQYKRIKKKKKQVLQLIEERTKALKKNLKRQKENKINNLISQRKRLEGIKNNIDESCQITMQTIEKRYSTGSVTLDNLDNSIGSLNSTINNLNELFKILQDDQELNKDMMSSFEVNIDDNDIKEKLKTWGNIGTNLTSIENSTISHVENKVVVHKKAHFIIRLRQSDEKIVHFGTIPNILITDSNNQIIDYEFKYSEHQSKIIVSYIPKTIDLLKIEITLNGQHLKGSPYFVQVILPMEKLKLQFRNNFGSKGIQQGQFNRPFFVNTDKRGNIFVSDSNNHRIQMFDREGRWNKSIGSNGSDYGQFNFPMGIAFNSKNHLIVSDSLNHRIQVFDEDLQFLRSFDSQGNKDIHLNESCGVAVDKEDNVLVVDSSSHCVHVFNKEGIWKQAVGRKGSGKCEFHHPFSIAICDVDGRIFVSDQHNHRIQVFNSDWKFLFQFGSKGPGSGQLHFPLGLVVSYRGKLVWVCDSENHRIQEFSATNGSFIRSYGLEGSENGCFNGPSGICVTSSAQLIVSEEHNNQIQIFE